MKDYLQGKPSALQFFSSLSWECLCEAVDITPRPERKEVAASLMEFNRSLGAPAEALENIRRLGEERALVVLTGQQPGILTGPLYTIYKACSAIQLSAHLSEELNRPVIPAFWVASEDHDFREISSICMLDGNGEAIRMGLPQEMGQGNKPVGSIPIDHDVRLFLKQFMDSLPEATFKGDVESCLRTTMGKRFNLGDWFSAIMSNLMGNCGLVMVDPRQQTLKRLSVPIFHKALAEPLTVTEMVNHAGDALEKAGYRRQIHKSDDFCPFFILNSGSRENVRLRGSDFQCGSGTFKEPELRAILEEQPHRFSPNAALRPIVSDYLLPVIAYVGGPGEIGYYAQLKQLYHYFGLPMPRLFLRKGMTFIEHRQRRILEKLGVKPLDLRDGEKLLAKILRATHGMASQTFWDERVARVESLLNEIRGDVAALDPTLLGALDTTVSSVTERIRRFESKLLKSLQQKETLLGEQIRLARQQVFPTGIPQERALNIFYFLATYGWELLRHIREGLPPVGEQHHFVYIA